MSLECTDALSFTSQQLQKTFDSRQESFAERKKQVPFSMAIENVELMHKCSPEPLRMGTVRMK